MSNKGSRPNSIQASNLDLTALGDALTDSPIESNSNFNSNSNSNSNSKEKDNGVSETEPYSLGDDDDDDDEEIDEEQSKGATDQQAKEVEGITDKKVKLLGKDSPETLSSDSSPSRIDSKPLNEKKESVFNSSESDSQRVKNGNDGNSDANKSTAIQPNQVQGKDSEQVEAIKNMFPDLDSDTISAVLVGTDGDVDAAINHLLSMSDPNYMPPSPSDTDSDAALARSLAAEQDSNSRVRPSGRGGSNPPLGWFGQSNPSQQQQQQQQQQPVTYNPNTLNYQPRQRKVPPSSNARAAYHAPPPPGPGQDLSPLVAGFPGSNEAKQWEESFNKFAENGMAKAASTFAALRTRAAALASSPTFEGGPSSSQSSTSNGGGGDSSNPRNNSSLNSGSFFSQFGLGGNNNNNGSSNLTRNQNPRSPQSTYDKDPEPVGEDELARILARGQASRSSSTSSSIGLGGGGSNDRNLNDDEEDDNDDDLWGGAGKVINKKNKNKPVINSDDDKNFGDKKEDFKPIEIKGASSNEGNQYQSQTQNQNQNRTHERDDSDENDSDVEYVANPFEEDD